MDPLANIPAGATVWTVAAMVLALIAGLVSYIAARHGDKDARITRLEWQIRKALARGDLTRAAEYGRRLRDLTGNP